VPAVYAPKTPLGGFTFDANKAKTLLQQAGVPNPTLKYVYYTSPDNDRLAQALQEQLRQVGITLNLTRFDLAGFAQQQAAGDFDIIPDAFGNSSGDPHPTFAGILRSKGARNYSRYANPAADALIDKIGMELDQTKRAGYIDDLFKIYFSEPPWAMTYASIAAYGLGKRLRGFVVGPTLDMYLSKLWVIS
jgi:peptide/nickel transport system substrate-binding protein